MTTWLLPLLLAASTTTPDTDLLRCRAISGATERLACYDAIPAAAPTAPKAAPAAPTAAEFGLEAKRAAETAAQQDTIESSIKGHFDGWRPNMAIYLANGQVWRISDDSDGLVDEDNPHVIIRRGALGTFFLEFDHTNKSPRVKRIR